MFTQISPKLPMRDKSATHRFFVTQLGFQQFGGNFDDYLMVEKDGIQLHFFLFRELDPLENYGQVYIRTNQITACYEWAKNSGVTCNTLETKPWGQREFSVWDPDNNLLTFGQHVEG